MRGIQALDYDISVAVAGTTHIGPSLTFQGAGGATLNRYILTVPNYTNAVTTLLRIVDRRGRTVWQGSAHNENDVYSVPVDIDLHNGDVMQLITSGATGGASPYTAILCLHIGD